MITSAYDITNGRLYQDLQLSLDSVDNRTTLPRESLNHFHQSWRKRDIKQSRFPLCIVKGREIAALLATRDLTGWLHNVTNLFLYTKLLFTRDRHNGRCLCAAYFMKAQFKKFFTGNFQFWEYCIFARSIITSFCLIHLITLANNDVNMQKLLYQRRQWNPYEILDSVDQSCEIELEIWLRSNWDRKIV